LLGHVAQVFSSLYTEAADMQGCGLYARSRGREMGILIENLVIASMSRS